MADHFVPQLLLRNFAISGIPGKVYAYRRNERISKPLSIRKAAAINNFYTLRSDKVGIDKRRIEASFGLQETGAAPILKHFLTSESARLGENDRAVLGFFIAGLGVRNPMFRDIIYKANKAAHDKHIRSIITDKETFLEHCKAKGMDVSDPEELERTRLKLQDFDKHTTLKPANAETIDWVKLLPFKFIEDLAVILLEKRWNILESDGARVFVISDNPVVFGPAQGRDEGDKIRFLDQPVVVPISPKRVLYMRNKGSETGVIRIKRERVDFLNSEIMKSAKLEIYSNIASQDIKSTFDKSVGE